MNFKQQIITVKKHSGSVQPTSTHLHNTLKTYDCQDKSEMDFGQNDEPEVINYNCEEALR